MSVYFFQKSLKFIEIIISGMLMPDVDIIDGVMVSSFEKALVNCMFRIFAFSLSSV